MKKNLKLNQEIVNQFLIFYREISETNFLDAEISNLIKNVKPQEIELIKEKYDIFFNKHQNLTKKADNHLALAINYSTVFETEIKAFASEKNTYTEKFRVYSIGKKYSKLRIYYQITGNKYHKKCQINRWTYPNFGVVLNCSLVFNGRIFKFILAKTGKGCDKINFSKVDVENMTITQDKELKFCSFEKFIETLNICETIIELLNVELEKNGLEKLISNIEISEK